MMQSKMKAFWSVVARIVSNGSGKLPQRMACSAKSNLVKMIAHSLQTLIASLRRFLNWMPRGRNKTLEIDAHRPHAFVKLSSRMVSHFRLFEYGNNSPACIFLILCCAAAYSTNF
jgi:hypothetical protein